jgi:ABC-type enterochelin transport system permease subunit
MGSILLGSHLLPHVFGLLAVGLGIAFASVGLIALFNTPILTSVVLRLQALWVLAAALSQLIRAGTTSAAAGEGRLDS